MQLLNFQVVAFTLDGTLCGKHPYVATGGQTANDLSRRSDNTKHTAIRVNLRQVVLLNGA